MGKWHNILIALLVFVFAELGAQTGFTFAIAPSGTYACVGLNSSFTASSSAQNLNYTWSVAPAKFAKLSATEGAQINIVFTKDLSYTVTATASDGSATGTQNYVLTAFKTATASYNAALDAVGYPAQLHLTNYSSNSIGNLWYFSDLTEPDSSVNLIKPYSSAGSYSVTLVALGQKNCNDTSTYSFRISDSSAVVIPNVFSPNRDEINDVFKPITYGIRSINVWVFNRDGIIVATWNRVQGSWDGRTASGEVCPDGVYFVVVEAQGFDDKTYKLKSNLTLVR